MTVPERAREAFEAALSEVLAPQSAIATIELREGIDWRLEAFTPDAPDRNLIGKAFAVVALALGLAPPSVTLSEIEDRDWVGENQRSFLPFTIGRYFINPTIHESKPLL